MELLESQGQESLHLIILDESVNSIDETVGISIMQEIAQEYRDRIIIIISHSDKYLSGCNKFVKIEGRKLSQSGSIH